MNYVREFNAFINWLETNPLDATAQALWFHLMAICNKCGWPEWFAVANLTLQAKLNITENTLARHRNTLAQKGRIEYKAQGKKQAGKYRIIPFEITSKNEANITVKNEVIDDNLKICANHGAILEVIPEVIPEVKPAALNKLNKTKLDILSSCCSNARAREDLSDVFTVYENNIGPIASIYEKEKLEDILQTYPALWVQKAIEIAVLNKARKLSYIEAILKNWLNVGVDKPWEAEKNGSAARDRDKKPRVSGNYKAEFGKRPSAVDWSSEPNAL